MYNTYALRTYILIRSILRLIYIYIYIPYTCARVPQTDFILIHIYQLFSGTSLNSGAPATVLRYYYDIVLSPRSTI